ncbi:MAG: hypothetical protein GY863_11545 [bacterium]|nr:hypothetical protein [bacterium]
MPKNKISQKEQIEKLVELMKEWQKIETESIKSTENLIREAENPLIRLLLEIIHNDSKMHKKVQQFIIDSYTKKAISLTPEELAELWDSITVHTIMEKKALDLGEESRKNCKGFVQLNLLTYLLEDEKKHSRILSQLEGFKDRIYPYM